MIFLLLLTNPCVIYFITPNKYCDDLRLSTKSNCNKIKQLSVLYRTTWEVISLLFFKQVMISTSHKHTISYVLFRKQNTYPFIRDLRNLILLCPEYSSHGLKNYWFLTKCIYKVTMITYVCPQYNSVMFHWLKLLNNPLSHALFVFMFQFNT
jgi:hypothetical protein